MDEKDKNENFYEPQIYGHNTQPDDAKIVEILNGTETPKLNTEQPTSEFECKSIGRIPNPNNCHEYYFCWHTPGPFHLFSCRSRVFDAKTKECVRDWAACSSTPKCQKLGDIMVNPTDKNSYFKCYQNKNSNDSMQLVVHKKKCAYNYVFDMNLGFCKAPHQETEAISAENEDDKEFECTSVGVFIDFSDETKYFECILTDVSNGILKKVQENCPKRHVFSFRDKKCIPL